MENNKKQTAVECLINELKLEGFNVPKVFYEKAKEMEKQQMCDFADFVATYTDKNKNVNGEMLHAKSKYDGAERTIDLLKEYLKNKNNETNSSRVVG